MISLQNRYRSVDSEAGDLILAVLWSCQCGAGAGYRGRWRPVPSTRGLAFPAPLVRRWIPGCVDDAVRCAGGEFVAGPGASSRSEWWGSCRRRGLRCGVPTGNPIHSARCTRSPSACCRLSGATAGRPKCCATRRRPRIPAAAVMLPVLAEAAGIPHTQPRLVVMPDDPRLGKFREAFANQLGTLEEYPTAASAGYGGFDNATQIISTVDLWTAWLQGPENRIDTRAFLRARFSTSTSRTTTAGAANGGGCGSRPGGMAAVARRSRHGIRPPRRTHDVVHAARQPRLLEFSEKYPKNLEGPTSNAAEVDRWLLTDLPGDVFEQTARELQAAWTDEVIDRTVAQLPKEWQALDKGFLAVRCVRGARAWSSMCGASTAISPATSTCT